MSVKYKPLEYKFGYMHIDEFERKREQMNRSFILIGMTKFSPSPCPQSIHLFSLIEY